MFCGRAKMVSLSVWCVENTHQYSSNVSVPYYAAPKLPVKVNPAVARVLSPGSNYDRCMLLSIQSEMKDVVPRGHIPREV